MKTFTLWVLLMAGTPEAKWQAVEAGLSAKACSVAVNALRAPSDCVRDEKPQPTGYLY